MTENGIYDFYTSGTKKYKIDTYAFEGPAITVAGNGNIGYMHLADGKFNAYQRTYVLTDFKADRQLLYLAIGNVLPKKIAFESMGGVISYIVMDVLAGLEVWVPLDEGEQAQIGNFFKSMDDQIMQQAQKIENLRILKAAYLRRMMM